MFRHISKCREGVRFVTPSKTAFNLKKMCDINNLIARVVRGDSTAIRSGGQFSDISQFPEDLQSALNLSILARDNFTSLPIDVQRRYTSYEAFLNALSNQNEREFLIEHGIFKTPEVHNPVKVEVVNADKMSEVKE